MSSAGIEIRCLCANGQTKRCQNSKTSRLEHESFPFLFRSSHKQVNAAAIADSLKCFDYYIEQKNAQDSKRCLQTWKVHAKEIDRFEEPTYQEFIKRLNEMKAEKEAAESAE